MVKLNTPDMMLPDYIDYQLNILSVGLNPSIPSVKMGYYFANPRNRFWRAFKQAHVIDDDINIDAAVHEKLLKNYSIGFTDVVKRASRMGHELRAEDFKRDAPELRAKIECYQPKLIWIHGKIAMNKFMQYAYGVNTSWDWGLHQIDNMDAKIYLTPNPSPANAAYGLEDLVTWYRDLRNL